MTNIPFTPTPSWASTWQGLTPSGLPGAGMGGLGSLPGAAGGVLSRGLSGGLSTIPRAIPFGSTLASQVPVGVGQQAFNAASALRPAAGQAGGLLSRLPTGGAGGLARGLGPANLTRGAGMAGLGYGIAGAAGSGLIDKLNPGGQNSNIEQGLQGVAQGAGIGAGVGALFGGVGAGPGALIGGAAGGAIGVLGNMFGFGGGGDDEAPDPVEILGTAINAANLDPATTEQILEQYEVMVALAEIEDDDELRQAKLDQAFDTAGQLVLQAMQQTGAAGFGGGVDNSLALQAQAQDIFAPLADDVRASGEMYAAAMGGIRDQLPPQYRAIADANVARELTSSQKLAAAYQAQAAVTPAINQLAQYQRDYNALAAQTWQQAMAGQIAGNAGGGQTADVAALLAPQ